MLLGNFQTINLSYLVYPQVFKIARPACEQVLTNI